MQFVAKSHCQKLQTVLLVLQHFIMVTFALTVDDNYEMFVGFCLMVLLGVLRKSWQCLVLCGVCSLWMSIFLL